MHRRALACGLACLSSAVAVISACSSRDKEDPCFSMIAPGVVIYVGGIDLLVRDGYGRGEALGTVATVYRGTDSIKVTGDDTLHLRAGYAQAGTFAVRLSRPFYRDTLVPNVQVQSGDCNILVTQLPVTLRLAPGAPPLRSVAIFGANYLVLPGEQEQLVARIDADPGADTRVAWSLTDTTLARIDDTGRVTAKCSTVGGIATAHVALVADPTIQATRAFGVQAQPSCP